MECKYDDIELFSEGMIPVMKKDISGNEKWGYSDKKGKEVIELQYDKVNNFSEDGLAAVAKKNSDGKEVWGILNIR